MDEKQDVVIPKGFGRILFPMTLMVITIVFGTTLMYVITKI